MWPTTRALGAPLKGLPPYQAPCPAAHAGEWVVLVLDSGKLTAEVKFEPAAPVGNKSSGGLLGGDQQQQQQQADGAAAAAPAAPAAEAQPQEPLFPHLYGTIDFEAVVGELPVERDASGRFLSIQGVPPADCQFSEFT